MSEKTIKWVNERKGYGFISSQFKNLHLVKNADTSNDLLR